jgi:NADH dehydrogenase FAD-containing subunit
VDCADTKGISGITEKGIVVGDKEYAVDCIIWATGYDVFGPGMWVGER